MTLPTPCGWYNTEYCPNPDPAFNSQQTFPLKSGPTTKTHTLSTNYTITVGNTIIPIIRTTRNWSVTYGVNYTHPIGGTGVAVFNAGTSSYDLYNCAEFTSFANYLATVSEVCTIEKSTLHYLDQRYGVCLYYYQKDKIDMHATSTEAAAFKVPEGTLYTNQIQIKTSNYVANSISEWILLVDGVPHILTHEEIELEPFGPRNNGETFTSGFAAGYTPDPETRKILVFPQPPSLAIPLSPEIVRLGFYDYGNLPGAESELNQLDGGNKDMFYPEWCRNLQKDSFWRAAADRRYQITWFNEDLIQTDNYVPPDISVDPLPIGSFVRHPVIGDVYQFLLGNTPVTSPDFNNLIDTALAKATDENGNSKNLKTHDTTLIYPISLI